MMNSHFGITWPIFGVHFAHLMTTPKKWVVKRFSRLDFSSNHPELLLNHLWVVILFYLNISMKFTMRLNWC